MTRWLAVKDLRLFFFWRSMCLSSRLQHNLIQRSGMQCLEDVTRISQKLRMRTCDGSSRLKHATNSLEYALKNLRPGPTSNVQAYKRKSLGLVNDVYFDHIRSAQKMTVTWNHFRKVHRNYHDSHFLSPSHKEFVCRGF